MVELAHREKDEYRTPVLGRLVYLNCNCHFTIVSIRAAGEV